MDNQECPYCEGTGEIWINLDRYCQHSGHISSQHRDWCHHCEGSGQTPEPPTDEEAKDRAWREALLSVGLIEF
jgi:DnaJ-class molecular chaperone